MKTKTPPFIRRVAILLALTGGFIGVLIGWNNGDDLGWALLRGAVLFIAFGTMGRWWLSSMAKAWLESRLETAPAKARVGDTRVPGRV